MKRPEKREGRPPARETARAKEHPVPENGTAADPLQTEALPRIGPVSSPDELPGKLDRIASTSQLHIPDQGGDIIDDELEPASGRAG
jgi:hypothetical protein